MWNEVIDDKTRTALLEEAGFFHDTCLTELRYVSGAYVGENLGMYPINDKRKVNVFIKRQEVERNTIELEFSGIEYLKLFPYDEEYTCEILGVTLILEDGKIFWCDCDDHGTVCISGITCLIAHSVHCETTGFRGCIYNISARTHTKRINTSAICTLMGYFIAGCTK